MLWLRAPPIVVAVNVVNAPVPAEAAPMFVPSIEPPLISADVIVVVPVAVSAVKVPATAVVAPMITLSMLPPEASISTAPSTSSVVPAPAVIFMPVILPPDNVALADVMLPLAHTPVLTVGDVNVLFVSVCVSVVPTKAEHYHLYELQLLYRHWLLPIRQILRKYLLKVLRHRSEP